MLVWGVRVHSTPPKSASHCRQSYTPTPNKWLHVASIKVWIYYKCINIIKKRIELKCNLNAFLVIFFQRSFLVVSMSTDRFMILFWYRRRWWPGAWHLHGRYRWPLVSTASSIIDAGFCTRIRIIPGTSLHCHSFQRCFHRNSFPLTEGKREYTRYT